MRTITSCIAFSMLLGLNILAARDAMTPQAPRVGEIRAIVLDRTDMQMIANLQREGWLEAHGQLVAVRVFPELFNAVGRTWTAKRIGEDQFALPDLERWRISSDNPYGVLGPGDLVTGGKPQERVSPISYWIFAGRDATPAARAAE